MSSYGRLKIKKYELFIKVRNNFNNKKYIRSEYNNNIKIFNRFKPLYCSDSIFFYTDMRVNMFMFYSS